jgi:nicotinamidase/pyrazinamidase
MTDELDITDGDVLLIVDVQNDFCPGGTLAVPLGDEIVPLVNRLARRFRHVALTQDWHPKDHLSFAARHPGRKAFETIELSYGQQVLWPDHCVQGSRGADFHAALDMPHAELILRKGCRREIDSYSAFFENDHSTPTGLCGYLRERGVARVFLAGLALDFCVRFTSEDARRCGFAAIVIEDACRAIDLAGSLAATHDSLARMGVPLISSSTLGEV